jgi:hypothetical protein
MQSRLSKWLLPWERSLTGNLQTDGPCHLAAGSSFIPHCHCAKVPPYTQVVALSLKVFTALSWGRGLLIISVGVSVRLGLV